MNADDIIKRMGRLEEKRAPMDGIWEQIRKICFPMNKAIYAGKDKNDDTIDRYEVTRLLDATALLGNQTLANGQLSNVTPVGELWFSFDAPAWLSDDDEAKAWFSECTAIAQREIAASNFYSIIHEGYLNRGAFGVGCLFIGWSEKKGQLMFREEPVGTYCLDEDYEQMVDTVFRRFTLTARQAVQMFESVPDAIRLKAADAKKQDERIEFIHAVFPRTSFEAEKGPLAMPWASVYVAVKEKVIVEENGFQDCPYAASRWMKWGDSVYGIGPGFFALPTAKQANLLEAMTDYSCEKATFPCVLVPSGFKYELDSRPGGITMFEPNGSGAPVVWQDQNGYQFNKDRVMDKREIIESFFFVPLFNMVAEKRKQMTAYEVQEIVNEKLGMFHPIFARMTTELLTPMLRRVFFLLFEKGRFPAPVEGVLRRDDQTQEVVDMAMPEVSFSSKIALAIKAQQLQAFNAMMQILMPAANADPSVLDVVNFEQACRDSANTLGMPVEWLRSKEEVDAMRQTRAQAQEQAAAMEQMAQAAGAIKDVGGVEQAAAITGL